MMKKIAKLLGLKKAPARDARIWSNRELAKFAHLCKGKIVNVSGWEDNDKEGTKYKDYFVNADSYTITNYDGWRGTEAFTDVNIDLEDDLADRFKGAFDVVFNHTTLEHIFDIQQAFRVLCELSNDLVIIVVPFIQHLHGPKDGDFWRPSPYAMRRMFLKNNCTILYESAGPANKNIRYLFYVATKKPEMWQGKFPELSTAAEKALRKVM